MGKTESTASQECSIWFRMTFGLLVFCYDAATYIFYYLYQNPSAALKARRKVQANIISEDTDSVTLRSQVPLSEPVQALLKQKKLDTMDKAFKFAVDKFGSRKCLGTRKILSEEGEEQSDGRFFMKYCLGDYEWTTYNEMREAATGFGLGLKELGVRKGQKVAILAETRAEWLIAAYACMGQSFPVVTLYATLGESAIAHGISETECETVITSQDLLPKFKKILSDAPSVKRVIYMEPQLPQALPSGLPDSVEYIRFSDVVKMGRSSDEGTTPPTVDDMAIIMYTSGSTGVPKGVVITHRNLITSLFSFASILRADPETDCYMAFLPLAHVLELLAESVCMLFGVPLGYSSPLTITDNSSKIKRGTKGDASVLRPSLMACVPLILDRIFKGIIEKVEQKGWFTRQLFYFCVNYKQTWVSRGFRTPLVDKFVFGAIKGMLGGRLRGMASGGAPLSPDTHAFIRTCMACPLIQGYGLTETVACATLMDWDSNTTGTSGAPLYCTDIKLQNWEEGNYRVTDKPNPRGEIIIGGDNVTVGYFKNEAQTKSDYFDSENRRWFRTGDIGEITPIGELKIIDRKKDLVKLQGGEYVSLGKVESAFKNSSLIENICVYGDPTKTFAVALVVPIHEALKDLAKKNGVADDSLSLEELCQNKQVEAAVVKELQAHGKRASLQKFEIPSAVKLCPEQWTPDSGLVTAAFKLRRKPIQEKYKEEIRRMYA